MAACTPQGANLLNGLQKINKFGSGLASQLPPEYRKFWREWKQTKPTAVHYIPKEGRFERNELTGEIRPIQNVPIPIIYPPEHNNGIWGGEGVVKGFQKRHRLKRRVPHFWVPVLRRSVLYSSVLHQYLSVTVTDRTMDLLHESHGFDHYLLKTLACDLKSELALKIKRKILFALQDGCPDLDHDPKKQEEILTEYKKYIEQYTPEEIEWYGLTFLEAIKKIQNNLREKELIVGQKFEFRTKLIDQLKEAGILEAPEETENSSWLSMFFGKKQSQT